MSKIQKAAKKLTELGFNVATCQEFYGRPDVKGLWIKEALTEDAEFMLYQEFDWQVENSKLNAAMNELGCFCEPYDSGTMMVHEI